MNATELFPNVNPMHTPALACLQLLLQAFPPTQDQIEQARASAHQVSQDAYAEHQAGESAGEVVAIRQQLVDLPIRLQDLQRQKAALDQQIDKAMMDGRDPSELERQLAETEALHGTLSARLVRLRENFDPVRRSALGERDRLNAEALRSRARQVRHRLLQIAPGLLDRVEPVVRKALGEFTGLTLELDQLKLMGY